MDSCAPVASAAHTIDDEDALREQMCRLWHTAFGDERDFIMHYLTAMSHTGNRILRFSPDGTLIAMMHFHKFTLCENSPTHEPLQGDEVSVRLSPMPVGMAGKRGAYIYGVATAPEWRGRGIAGAMIAEAVEKMRRSRAGIAMLIAEEPSLRRWYASMGFSLAEGITAAVAAPDGTNLALDDTRLNLPLVMPL